MGTPINAIDAACQRHDYEFGEASVDWTSMQSVANWNKLSQQQQSAVKSANQNLCNAMNAIYPSIPGWNASQNIAVMEISLFFMTVVPAGAQCQ